VPTRSISIALAIGMGLALGWTDAAPAEPQYVGEKKCRSCHRKKRIGNQYRAWKEGRHSQAFASLKGEEALEIARERGLTSPPREAEECVKCHVTAFGEHPSEFARKPLAHEDGVQCESCHGPGSRYRKKKIMSDHAKAVAAGMWEPDKDEKICTSCHNEGSPFWDPAVGFDFEKSKEKIAHPIPAEFKEE
jgi:hypothetical protein